MRVKRPIAGIPSPENLKPFLGLFLLCVLACYGLLFGRYRLEDLDDAWSLSYARNFFLHGLEGDPTFGGPDRILYFGKTQAWLMGAFLQAVGWTRNGAHLFSLFFLVAGVSAWVFLLRRMKFPGFLAMAFGALALLTEPFLASAFSARPEAFVFCLCSLSLLFFVQGRYFLFALAGSLAVESHPMGIMALFWAGAAALAGGRWREVLSRKALIPLAAGGLTGLLYFLWLHGGALAGLGKTVAEGNTQEGRALNNYLFDYFLKTQYHRHLPELAAILAAVFLYAKGGRWKSSAFPWVFFWVTAASTLLLSRPNYHYALYAYPAFLLLILQVAENRGRLKTCLLLFLLLLLPQYGFVYRQNRSFDFEGQLRALKAAVPEDKLPVLGSANEWFAFPDREFYSTQYVGDYRNLVFKEAYLIEENDYRADPISMRHWVPENFNETVLAGLSLNGETYVVKKILRSSTAP